MKNLISKISLLVLMICVSFSFVCCGKANRADGKLPAEKVSLAKVMISDVEFENSKSTEIKQEGSKYTISGTIDSMSKSQKIAFGSDEVTHVVALKFTFDKERTISAFEIAGNEVKVYSDDKKVKNYVGSISELLDSEEGEDAYCNLVLSANTKSYRLKSTYSDGTESTIEVEIAATLATAKAE